MKQLQRFGGFVPQSSAGLAFAVVFFFLIKVRYQVIYLGSTVCLRSSSSSKLIRIVKGQSQRESPAAALWSDVGSVVNYLRICQHHYCKIMHTSYKLEQNSNKMNLNNCTRQSQ